MRSGRRNYGKHTGPKIDILKYVKAVERHQSFPKAAAELGIARQSLHTTLQRHGYAVKLVLVKVRPSIYE